jgi:hypothetical protein
VLWRRGFLFGKIFFKVAVLGSDRFVESPKDENRPSVLALISQGSAAAELL